ncbi:M20 family metallopeptidase [Pigmentiphaga sp.]|uniref:M20 metallopeptidase family protein n=1 Tax=Pigmentiphaga sp. TaxID=1977564 RepID=UPI0025E20CEC|nr:M20 family metallopeptidase [Pigmentiphaga sp.]
MTTFSLLPGRYDELVRIRRDIHRHPELAFAEHRTAAIVRRDLAALGLAPLCGVAGTGVVAVLDTGRAGRTVGLRVDLDALPMTETADVPFKSEVPGTAHTCGHDVHCVIGLGAASLLCERRDTLRGRFKFIFQPAEETLEGARAMIEAGVLDAPAVDVLLGCHNSPQLETGRIGYRHGASMASSSAFVIDVRGTAGHAAHPRSGVDALQALPMLLAGLNAIRAKEVAADQPLILSVGRIQGGRARNVICDSVTLEGTCRTLDDAVRDEAEAALRRLAQGTAMATRTTVEVQWRTLAPALVNDRETLDRAIRAIGSCLGAGALVELDAPSMGGEDFAWYTQRVPAAHLRIGSRCAGRSTQLHQSDYFCDERAIESGAVALAAAAAELASS